MEQRASVETYPADRNPAAVVVGWLAAQSGAGMVAFGLAGLLTGTLIVFVEPIAHWIGGLAGIDVGSTYDANARGFLRRQETALWLFLVCGQVGLWAVLLVPIARAVDQLRRWWRPARVAGYVGVVLGSTAVVGIASAKLVDFPHFLPGHEWKIGVITALGTCVAAFAASGVACVAIGSEHIVQDLSPTISTADWERRTEMLLEARAALDSLLACTATIIGAAIISTGVLRNATIPWEQAHHPGRTAEAIFPEEQVLAYGIFYSAVLALLYLPVYERLTRAARKLRDGRAPLIWPPREQWKERADERALLDRMLKLDQSAITGFRLAAGVLAPLASSVITRALGSG
jgi:hypothetical protein